MSYFMNEMKSNYSLYFYTSQDVESQLKHVNKQICKIAITVKTFTEKNGVVW